jgi:hypothetical protein
MIIFILTAIISISPLNQSKLSTFIKLSYKMSFLHNLKMWENKSVEEEQERVGILEQMKSVYDYIYINFNNQHFAIKSM